MKKATKTSVIMSFVFVLISLINLIMEYKNSNSSDLIFKWVLLVILTGFAVVAFIRYRKQIVEEMGNLK